MKHFLIIDPEGQTLLIIAEDQKEAEIRIKQIFGPQDFVGLGEILPKDKTLLFPIDLTGSELGQVASFKKLDYVSKGGPDGQ